METYIGSINMERSPCYGGFGTWTKFVSWLQTILNIGSIFAQIAFASVALYSAVILGIGLGMIPWDLVDRGVILTPDAAYTLKNEAHRKMVISSVGMALGILSFVVSLVLLKGIYDANLKLLNAWVVAASVCITFWIAMLILWAFFTFRDMTTVILVAAAGPIPLVIVQSLFLWIVCGHRRQMRTEAALNVQYYSAED